ncbi:cytochrome bd-I ubiquinol oxidase subunit 1 apoprotein [Noviherbaspirillum humi]|uniref:Cytochrome bd-I ubiquinol oxidase subunit 1 apoprotein n=1 Tax=Noviherbaspirillum humi TaxID=1688639 RepID=A0A239J4R7_9BURK|nr:cytochrome ubiquinol oxidase subunit I [Noviherbaspirillum humi]SNT00891.1 cytochrome bd-I ubiquinol oxidase subunit 1 apoprotein [Noviherbaspirillum humi]
METIAGIDTLLFARIQFAFTVSFHIIFPAFSIGLGAFIATLEVRWLLSGDSHFHTLARFWTKIFAVSFAMGVVSGIVMEYQLGTSWSRFAQVVGNSIGPLFGYEVLTAFFLEASFLGLMLFGWNRVPPWVHTFASIMVALGTAISGFWILSANSWMHTPAGVEVRDGITYPVSWFDIIFNPSFPYRFTHMMIATYLTTSLVVLATGARYVLAGRFEREARTMMRMGLGMVMLLAPIQIFVGDMHGLNTLEHQPAKIAAMEAHWDGSKPADLVLFAWPDEKNERNLAEVAIPGLGSVILKHERGGLFPGLKQFKPQDRPPVKPVFFAFRVMVGIGMLLLTVGVVGGFLWWRKRLFTTTWFLKPVGHLWPLGFIAIIAGWITTEVGRQPWIAYGILRTADAVSPVTAAEVATSLALFVLVYFVVFGIGIYYVYRMLRKGPKQPEKDKEALANRPLSAAQETTGDPT